MSIHFHDPRDPLSVMKDYVTGDAAETDLFSGLKGHDREDLLATLDQNRGELERIDPARSVILESIL